MTDVGEVLKMRFKWAKSKNQWFLIPCIGIIDERHYYDKVFAVAFAWLVWRFKVEFGVKRFKGGAENG